MTTLFGVDMNTWQPYHGCTSFSTDLVLGRIPGNMAECLAELDRAIRYRSMQKESEISIQVVNLRQGYSKNGTYYGSGMKLYEVCFENICNHIYYHKVRATDRKSLRDALKLLYPFSKVNR